MSSNEVGQTFDVNTLIDGYCAAWNERDRIKRLVTLAEVLTPDVRYVDSAIDLTGREALAAHIDIVFARYPGSGYCAPRASTDITTGHASAGERYWLTDRCWPTVLISLSSPVAGRYA
ncbi:nuclear transport factor 2 family protein [Bradyrhizobium sp. 62B]|uniref:nuclear transport factor 2 family protein n=1 Tax=Bradyrhizobium sp. 62B TaxID=2898442 RepID=UPI002557EBB4|nr:nuclear transport factor 2 family protein [Bradyrhizobium sp. 62B]